MLRIGCPITSAAVSPRVMNGSWKGVCWGPFWKNGAFWQLTCLQQKTKKKCSQFCSQVDFSTGLLIDAFHLNWELALIYMFPLIPLILKLKLEHANLILIAPAWLRQCWLSDLHSLSIQSLRSPPLIPDLLTQHHTLIQHPALSCLHLMAWMLHEEEEQCLQAVQRQVLFNGKKTFC